MRSIDVDELMAHIDKEMDALRNSFVFDIEPKFTGTFYDQGRIHGQVIAYDDVKSYINRRLSTKAKWIGKPLAGRCTVRCSNCRHVFIENNGLWNFCPNCGADMRGDEK